MLKVHQSNQVFTQTNEDDVSTEIQTEEIFHEFKWTQHPIEITKNQLTDDINPFEVKCNNTRR